MSQPDPSLGWAAIDWTEHYLVHGPGDVQGQPIELDDEFAAFLVKCYRVDPKMGAKVVRRAFLSRSKGRSKSGLAAMIACFEALGPCRFDHWAEADEVSDWGYEYEEGEPVGAPLKYAEILNVATEEGQAGNTYDAIYYMLNPDTCSATLLEDFGRIDVGLAQTNLPNHRGFIEPVSSSNESKDGGKSTFIVADETHLWIPPAVGKFRLGKMHQTMVRNLLKRKVASGWMLETSTMYAEGEKSVAEGTHAYAESLRRSGRHDGKLLFDHRQASDHWDLDKRSERLDALREAYGPAAEWMDLEAIADYWDDPQASHAEFKRFWLNQPVPLEEKPPLIFPSWMDRISDQEPDPEALGIAANVEQTWISLGAFGSAHGGPVVRMRFEEGRAAFIAEVKRIALSRFLPVAIQVPGPASALVAPLRDDGVDVFEVNFDGFAIACSDLMSAVNDGEFTHGNYADLNDALEAAEWRYVADRLVLSRKTGDISMLEAVTLARWAALQVPTYDPLLSIG